MKSQYPSQKPVEFPDTVEGFLDMAEHDHEWAVGSGYMHPDSAPFDREAARAALGDDPIAELRRRGWLPDED